MATYICLSSFTEQGIRNIKETTQRAAFALALGSAGNVRTQMLRAFTKEEMKNVLKKMSGQKVAVPA
jgi:uncharacterized protein with GYD domain